jgi:hypothetical protein
MLRTDAAPHSRQLHQSVLNQVLSQVVIRADQGGRPQQRTLPCGDKRGKGCVPVVGFVSVVWHPPSQLVPDPGASL